VNISIYASQNPIPVGSNVTIYSTASVTTGVWLFESTVIVISYPGTSIIANTWSNRITFNPTNSSLCIRSLGLNDSGVYTLDAVNLFNSKITLSVQVPISNVTLWAKATNLVEFNDTAVFICSVGSGTSLSYVWLNGSSVVTEGGRVQLSNGNTNLTIFNVTRYDVGPFACNVSNGVSHGASPSVNLNISYGPSDPAMMITPMASKCIYRTGSSITLSCSAESSPPAMITWKVNDVYLSHFGPQLQLQNATVNNSGDYVCLFYNNVTLRLNIASAAILIMGKVGFPISSVVVSPANGPAILNNPFTLQCEVTGPLGSIQWWRNDQLITSGNATFFHNDNKTLVLNPVYRSDNGVYQCQALNAVSNLTSSPYTVYVNYGPEDPVITGPNVAKTGDNITLTCSALSYPPSCYEWYFNSSVVANTSTYVTLPLTKDMSGKYTCMAYNNITGQNSTAYLMLDVIAQTNPAIVGHSYKLTCNVTGPATSVSWMMNDVPLDENNTDIIFNSLEISDTGVYQCLAMNAVGNMTSPPYNLLVNFGPETPIINGPQFAETGHSAHFSCSAQSQPPSQFTWLFNNRTVANTSQYIIDSSSLNMSGQYTCEAYNSVTENYSQSSIMLTVIEAIKSVIIKNDTVPINMKNLTLTCEVFGPYDSISWLKDNKTLNMNNSDAKFVNNTLQFTPVTLNDDGTYQCVATNQVAPHKSPEYMLQVNYGPLSVNISGPNSAKPGLIVSWTCSATSRPNCYFKWFFNNQSVPLQDGSVIKISAIKDSEGNYTCKAWNPVTNITDYQTKAFTVGHASAIHFLSRGSLMLMGLLTLCVPVLFT
uniref:CEA cell adhesion molecule 1 n=1 Tax=Mastacembelus armatus TaxID=205130 RepID=A0A3Q3LC98_9TELE